MTIDVGYVANPDEVLNSEGLIFKNLARTLFSSTRAGWTSGTTSALTNMDLDVYATDTMTKSGFIYNSTSKKYIGFTNIIGNQSGAVDTNEGVYTNDGHKWGQTFKTQASVTNPTIYFRWKTGAGSISGNITVILANTSGGLPTTTITSNTFPVSSLTGSYAWCGITFTTTLSANTTYAVYIDAVGGSDGSNTLHWARTNSSVYADGSYAHQNPSSSWTVDVNKDYLFYYDASATIPSPIYIQSAGITTATVTNAILVVGNTVAGGSTALYYLSANGTNFEAVIPNQIHRFTNTGTSLKFKVTRTGNTDYSSDFENEYAILYNLY